MKIKCNEIKIGNRVRRDLGAINELADNIKELGLLQPVGITKDNELVFGERRLAACKSLNYEEIEVVVIDSNELLECETTENVNRKSFVMSERVEIRKLFKDRIIEERGKTLAKGNKVGNLPTFRVKDKLAKLSGVSRRTADKENEIVAFGDQDIIDKVDNNELSVNKAYCLIKKTKKEIEAPDSNNDNEVNILPAEEIVGTVVEQAPVDNNTYNIILSDTYDSLELTKSLTDKIKYHSEKTGMSSLSIIETMLNQAFEDYVV